MKQSKKYLLGGLVILAIGSIGFSLGISGSTPDVHAAEERAVESVPIESLPIESVSIEDASTNERVHPREEFIPHVREAVLVPRIEKQGAYAQQLLNAKEVRSFGLPEGEKEEMIGSLEDARIHEGKAFVLDGRYNEVRIYDLEDGTMSAFSGPGRGAAELMAPLSLDVDPTGTVYVSDRSNQAFKTFAPKDGTYDIESTTTIKLLTAEVCALRDQILLRGVIPSRMSEGGIHIYESGEYKRSYGGLYSSGNDYINMRLSDGPMDCKVTQNGSGRVVSGFLGLPTVEVYDQDQSHVRTFRFEDFEPIQVTDQGNGRTFFDASHADVNVTKWVTLSPEGNVLAQVVERTNETDRERIPYHRLHSYLLFPDTGKSEYLGTDLPPVLDVTETHMIAGSNHPYPRLRVYKLANGLAK